LSLDFFDDDFVGDRSSPKGPRFFLGFFSFSSSLSSSLDLLFLLLLLFFSFFGFFFDLDEAISLPSTGGGGGGGSPAYIGKCMSN
jgi:hypothetical protein